MNNASTEDPAYKVTPTRSRLRSEHDPHPPTAHNVRAVGLYESEGFRSIAREEDAFRDLTPRTELTMTLTL